MSSRGLQVRTVNPGSDLVQIAVDSPTRGVAIVDVQISPILNPAPLHWRAGDWTKPPLDVSLGPDGRPKSLQVVFQDEEVPRTNASEPIQAEVGVPIFDIGDWPANRYLDTRTVVQMEHLESDELAVRIGTDQPDRWLQLGPGLEFGFDAAGTLVKLIIGPLDDGQWRLIAAAAPTGG